MYPEDSQTAVRLRRRFTVVTVILFIFSVIYEHFGRGVWSPYMIYCWCAPFVLGVLPMHLCAKHPSLMPGRFARYCLFFCAATAAVGCVVQGALEIYGTSNRLCAVYLYACAVLLPLSAAAWGADLIRRRKHVE